MQTKIGPLNHSPWYLSALAIFKDEARHLDEWLACNRKGVIEQPMRRITTDRMMNGSLTHFVRAIFTI